MSHGINIREAKASLHPDETSGCVGLANLKKMAAKAMASMPTTNMAGVAKRDWEIVSFKQPRKKESRVAT